MNQDNYNLEYQKQMLNYSQQNVYISPEQQQQQQQLGQQYNNCWLDENSIVNNMRNDEFSAQDLHQLLNQNTIPSPPLSNNLSPYSDQSSSSPPMNNNLQQYGDQMVSQPMSNGFSPYSDQSSGSPPMNNNLQYGDQMLSQKMSNGFSSYSDQSSSSPPINSNLSPYGDHQSLSPELSSNLSQYGEQSLSPPLSNNISPCSDQNIIQMSNNMLPYGDQNISLNNNSRNVSVSPLNNNFMEGSTPQNILPSVGNINVQHQQQPQQQQQQQQQQQDHGQHCQVVPAIEPCNSPPSNFPIKIDYKVFPEIIPKHQKRVKGKSEQRIKNGLVSFTLDFQDMITFQLIENVQVAVKQTNEVVGTPQYIGPVELKPNFTSVEGYKWLVEVDLDSVYEVNGKKVYELQKTLTEELNNYHLIIDVSLKDGRTAKLKTKEFRVLGKETNNSTAANNNKVAAQKPQQATKKKRKLSSSSDELVFNFVDEEIKDPLASNVNYNNGHGPDKELIRAKNIVADYVKAKSIEIDGTLISRKIETPNGDIAYHFQLEDSNDFFQEGEIVGLYSGGKDSKPKLIKLTTLNCNEVSLKGVITRSQYFEAMKPPPGIISETVCMMGIVPVKVQGKVNANDPLYASSKVPGVAVSGVYLNDDEIKYAKVVGYAFQNLHQKEHEIRCVQAGVSVLTSVAQTLLNKRLLSVEQNWERQIVQLEDKNSKFKQYFQIVGFIALFVIILIGILLWQLLSPGSAFRYYKCKIGSNHGRLRFTLEKGMPIFDNFDVNGVEFGYNALMDKIKSNSYKNDVDKRYFLNIDRCAFGGERSTIDRMSGGIRVSGPIVFAVDKNCTNVFSFYEYENNWRVINGTNKVTNLHCIS